LTIGGAPVRRDSLFRIASTTKPLTAAPTLAIVDDGLIGLDEPVDRLLPELADRQVLRRMDGPLHDIVPAERAITTRDVQTYSDTSIANLGTLPLLAKPGERWMYNTGASVLSGVTRTRHRHTVPGCVARQGNRTLGHVRRGSVVHR
jgi:CubicO group peptidase (beta-lactamase class C family)